MTEQRWFVVGQEYLEEATSVGRSVSDDMLFRIAIGTVGQQRITLIYLGASHYYMSIEITAICERDLEPEIMHLELVDGSKMQSMQKVSNVYCSAGR